MIVTQPGRVQTAVPGILNVVRDEVIIDLPTNAAARVVDVAPTVLYALGVPISRELAGEPLRQLFGGRQERVPRAYVPTYGRVRVAGRARDVRSIRDDRSVEESRYVK